MRPSDSALVEKARRGDQDAFARLVELSQGKVYNLALRLTGSPENASDVAQEAFLNAWRGLPSFRGESSFSTWLYKLTSNAATDFLRRQARQRGLESPLSLDEEDSGLANLTPDPAPSPQQQLEHRELQAALSQGLAQLPREQRQALSLRLAGLSYAEIAQSLDVEQGTVKSRIARARLALREYLQKTGNFSAPPASKQAERTKGGEDA